MDRTTEFFATVDAIRVRGGVAASARNGSHQRLPGGSKSQFAAAAGQIGKEIVETSAKLERLTKLAKKKSLFDDPAIEIQELTAIVNADIKQLNRQLAVLSDLKRTGQPRRNRHTDSHSDSVLDSLKHKLQGTTKDFSEVLELRTENLKAQQKEREVFTGAAQFGRRAAESPLYKQPGSPSVAHHGSEASDEVAIAMPGGAQQQQLTVMHGDRYLQTRAEAVTSIERTISELQGIFGQLAALVQEQGDAIERIDHNVDQTIDHVDSAQTALLKYLQTVSSNRWLMLKVAAILLVFFIIWIVVL
eukprot:TRINITY_DN6055_c0_g1_i1.p1 TRINITY_DN6055_c0_g1~~TRINITY_DN6055_c0_g1_i1.p1  ORF type:complete len:303 (+),score=153.60 TRINITY_DN6055_c0_g1_i1:276-1184(+)